MSIHRWTMLFMTLLPIIALWVRQWKLRRLKVFKFKTLLRIQFRSKNIQTFFQTRKCLQHLPMSVGWLVSKSHFRISNLWSPFCATVVFEEPTAMLLGSPPSPRRSTPSPRRSTPSPRRSTPSPMRSTPSPLMQKKDFLLQKKSTYLFFLIYISCRPLHFQRSGGSPKATTKAQAGCLGATQSGSPTICVQGQQNEGPSKTSCQVPQPTCFSKVRRGPCLVALHLTPVSEWVTRSICHSFELAQLRGLGACYKARSDLWKDAGVPSLQMAFGSVSSCLNKLVAEEKERVRSRRWEGESLISTVSAENIKIKRRWWKSKKQNQKCVEERLCSTKL